MGLRERIKAFGEERVKPRRAALDFLKFIGPGFLVTVGFIDPGNWATNVAAGAQYGYTLLWMVTLSTAMLIVLQHNAAHLGIATGLCLSEAATDKLPRGVSVPVLGTATLAACSTALAEVLGGAIALRMLTGLPIALGAILCCAFALLMILANGYRRIEKIIIGFVSLIGLSFIFELSLVHTAWGEALAGWALVSVPDGSMPIVMGVLGAVVMPHNLFLHSEIIQSRQWNLGDEASVKKKLKYEFLDTIVSMLIGFAINSAMIILAAATFHERGVPVTELEQAQAMLAPLIGGAASIVFAVALLAASLASSVTAGMAGGSIVAGIFKEPFDPKDKHSRLGVVITLVGALIAIFFVGEPFKALIASQIALSVQLPITIFLQIALTSSKRVMGKYANSALDKTLLWAIGLAVTAMNVLLLVQLLG